MRIRIHHQTTYSYDRPAQSMVQLLRLTPRDHEGQYVRRWRIDLDDSQEFRKKSLDRHEFPARLEQVADWVAVTSLPCVRCVSLLAAQVLCFLESLVHHGLWEMAVSV